MNFNKLVKEIIEPVLCFFDFLSKREINGIVDYSHDVLTISISYDYNTSFEVDVTFTFNANGMFYDYSEMKEYFCNQKANLITTQITNDDSLKVWLESVQIFLKENLSDIINRHEKICGELERLRLRRIDDYDKNRDNRFLKDGVEKFWTNKDYSGLIFFLKSYKMEFEGSIKKKYEYAIKMVGKK